MTGNPTAYRWPAYYLAALAAFVAVALALYSSAHVVPAIETTPLPAIIGAPFMLAVIGTHFRSVVAYHEDAKYLTESSADYHPRWWFWAAAQLFAGPLAAVAYLLLRRSRVGFGRSNLSASV